MNNDEPEKVELHCHLDGLLCPRYVEALQAEGFCRGLNLDQMRGFYPVTSLESWFRLGEFVTPFFGSNGDLFLEVFRLHLQDLVAQNVAYAEIMLCSFLFQYSDGDRMEELMAQYRRVADDCEGIEIGLLWAIGRSRNRQRFETKVERIRRLWRKGYLDGLAVAGNETCCKIKDYADVFDVLRDEGLPVEIHAGEWCGPESVWDALEYGHPRRIGHGLSIFDDPALLEHVRKHNIHFEFCPTSNLKVAGVGRIEEHPVFRAVEQGLNFSINTDDPGHFECTMNSEFELLQRVNPLDDALFSQIRRNSLGAAFGKHSRG